MGLTESVQNVIWVLVPILQAAIGVSLWRRKLIGTFPVFFAYIVYHLLQHLLGAATYGRFPATYFWVYWANEGVDALLTLAVIQEIFVVVFKPYEALRRLGVITFRSLTILLCIVAAVVAVASPAAETNRTMAALLALDRSVQIVQLGLLFFLFVFCQLFGMTWRHYVFGIAAGFFVMTAMGTAVLAVRAHEGQGGNVWWFLFSPVGFTLGNCVWTYYFAFEKGLVPLNIVPRTDQLVSWNQALTKVGQR